MNIDASLVKELRGKTGAGIMNCKIALQESEGDFEKAIDWLRKKGLSAAAKKSSRITTEGLTAIAIVGKSAAVIEINSETDFVAKNELFQNLVDNVVKTAVNCSDLEQLENAQIDSGKAIKDLIVESIATIGENINLRRMQNISVENGLVASYIHNKVTDNMGKIAVLVALESDADHSKLQALGSQIAMHIAAAKPECLDEESLDPKLIEKEKEIFFEKSRQSGKPDNIITKMIDGRIRKFLEEVVLMNQVFVVDGKTKISDLISNRAKELSTTIRLTSYVRFELGDGIEKKQANFADEVASVAAGV